MKQVLFILAVALYLVSLCACGDQKIQSKPKQDSAIEQVVQEQMANATGKTTAPFRSRSRHSLPKRSQTMNRRSLPATSTLI